MAFSGLRIGTALAVALPLAAMPAALSWASEARVEELQRKLAEQDEVIRDLRARIDSLERHLLDGAHQEGDLQPEHTDAPTAARQQPSAETGDEADSAPPGQVIVDPEEAERALERSLVEVGGLLLRPGRLEVQPSLRYARQEASAPATIGRDGDTLLGQRERNVDEITADLDLRLGLPFDSQLELGLPYRWRSIESVREVNFSPVTATSATGSGVGNLRLGLAKTLLREGRWRPDLIGRVTWDTRSGAGRDDGVSISSDFHELRGSFIAIKRQDPLVFLGGLAFEHVFERDGVQPGQAVTPTIGSLVALSPETSMRFVLSQTFRGETEVGGTGIPGSDETAATFTIGGSSLLARGILVNLSVGIGLTRAADDYSVRLAVPIRFDTPIF